MDSSDELEKAIKAKELAETMLDSFEKEFFRITREKDQTIRNQALEIVELRKKLQAKTGSAETVLYDQYQLQNNDVVRVAEAAGRYFDLVGKVFLASIREKPFGMTLVEMRVEDDGSLVWPKKPARENKLFRGLRAGLIGDFSVLKFELLHRGEPSEPGVH